MRRAEGNLLNLGKVILCILVQDDSSNLFQWELALWPNVCQIKYIDLLLLPKLLGLLGSDGLDVHSPAREVALFNGVVEILLGVVGGVVSGFFGGDPFDALVGLPVDLDIDPFAALVDELEGVATVTVHVAVAIWNTTLLRRLVSFLKYIDSGPTYITEENHDLVDSFWVVAEVIPEHGRIIATAQVGRWMSLLGVDEVWELCWIPQEENGSVVSNEIPIAFVLSSTVNNDRQWDLITYRLGTYCSELDGETTRVSCGVVGASFTTNSGETNGKRAFLSLLRKHVGNGELWDGVCALEEAMGTRTLCVDDSLWYSLSTKDHNN